ncbi:hypothetical protein AKJ52_00100 [candidate division MSBL1 archaeon SCGC-AAA382C18]|uniref:Sulfatase N-terminal domain-containing protein n=1 Tax=candidate division MSBL1 archaeon SCGC-AAA382C18 TaxID=1698281 RepID=A0A133VM58_9EURY|nr:hypothetical protein AKJ52_00100 [candidate division MSBL1 archaeon SCGC-AAA382C18]
MRNIVMVTLESTRADHCGFLGYDRDTTPNMGKMAGEGVCFENAYSPAPRTLSSMISTFTGEPITQYIPCNSEVDFGKNGRMNLERKKTLAEALSERGYTTGAFNPSAYASSYFGFDKGFDHFQDFMFEEGFFDKYVRGGRLNEILRHIRNLIKKEEAFKTWDTYYDEILDWVENVEEPFFLWIFLLDTHFPYLTPGGHRKWTNFLDSYLTTWKLYRCIGEKSVEFSEGDKEKVIGSYDSSIRYADRFLGRVRENLKGLDPVFIVNADHGEAFFERGVFGHFFPYLYEENIRVPWIIYNVDREEDVQKPVSMLDLYPTVMNLSDSNSSSLTLPGEDGGGVVTKDISFREGEQRVGVRLGRWKYIVGQEGSEELYDLENDPNEEKNKAEKNPKLVKEISKISGKYTDMDSEKIYLKNKISDMG